MAPDVFGPTSFWSNCSGGPYKPVALSTAKSRSGSNQTVVARCWPFLSITTGESTPATTCALVAMYSGATTKPDPNTMPPQPKPEILTVEAEALLAAAATSGEFGSPIGAC